MATICEFGTAPQQRAEGYEVITELVYGTESEVLERFGDQDVRLVIGASVLGKPEHYEFAVLAKKAASN